MSASKFRVGQTVSVQGKVISIDTSDDTVNVEFVDYEGDRQVGVWFDVDQLKAKTKELRFGDGYPPDYVTEMTDATGATWTLRDGQWEKAGPVISKNLGELCSAHGPMTYEVAE